MCSSSKGSRLISFHDKEFLGENEQLWSNDCQTYCSSFIGDRNCASHESCDKIAVHDITFLTSGGAHSEPGVTFFWGGGGTSKTMGGGKSDVFPNNW